jgi:hypothetical protein
MARKMHKRGRKGPTRTHRTKKALCNSKRYKSVKRAAKIAKVTGGSPKKANMCARISNKKTLKSMKSILGKKTKKSRSPRRNSKSKSRKH